MHSPRRRLLSSLLSMTCLLADSIHAFIVPLFRDISIVIDLGRVVTYSPLTRQKPDF